MGGEVGEEGGGILLRRSRESTGEGQGWLVSRGSCRITPPTTPVATPTNTPIGSISDKEAESVGGKSSPALSPTHPALTPDLSTSPNPTLGLVVPYPQLPILDPSISPRPPAKRPARSAGNLFISFLAYEAEQEKAGLAEWAPIGTALSSEEGTQPSQPSPAHSPLTPGGGSHSGATAGSDGVGLSTFLAAQPSTQETATSGFRRRSQTLDSRPCIGVDRSQERVPRFMGGVPWRPPCRRSPPAPLNPSFDPESPVPALLRSQGVPVSTRSPLHSPNLTNRGLDTAPRLTLDLLTTSPEHPANKTGEAQWEVQALEEERRRLEEEHALQLSLLIAEQEREQQRLQQELEERERRLREQGAEWEVQRDSCPARNQVGPASNLSAPALSPAGPILNLPGPALSPAGPTLNVSGPTLSPGERSPGPVRSMGLSSVLSPCVPPVAVQPPAYLWSPSWGVSKARGRQSLVLTPELHAVFCRLTAVAHGFLTRRLLNTEKMRHLRQTVQDTQEFIHSFRTEAPLRRGDSVSAQDLSLQERVRAQLRAALFDVHDIFFEMPLLDRLALLQQDREVRLERKLREMEKAKSPRDRVTLSAATQKALDRRKQRVIGSPGHTRRMQTKPKSPPSNRVLKPCQGQNTPNPGQLLRQGSLYRKTPEDRVRQSVTLRKQHSLGLFLTPADITQAAPEQQQRPRPSGPGLVSPSAQRFQEVTVKEGADRKWPGL
ncbi:hypothetical protein GJAV_G00222120 [Gymnothorax javanicus]|nr:hypothetical protein GJAV_G00222120 [Gymnothorax javanicus]